QNPKRATAGPASAWPELCKIMGGGIGVVDLSTTPRYAAGSSSSGSRRLAWIRLAIRPIGRSRDSPATVQCGTAHPFAGAVVKDRFASGRGTASGRWPLAEITPSVDVTSEPVA